MNIYIGYTHNTEHGSVQVGYQKRMFNFDLNKLMNPKIGPNELSVNLTGAILPIYSTLSRSSFYRGMLSNLSYNHQTGITSVVINKINFGQVFRLRQKH